MVQEESAMHSYTVQRSLDGVNWSEIGKVYALNSQGHHSYYVYDHHRPAGISYYRLQLTDSKGQSTLSSVVQVDNSPAKTVSVKGATLVKTNLSLQVYSPNADVYSVRLYSMQGQLLAQKTIYHRRGQQSTECRVAFAPTRCLVCIDHHQ